MPRFDLAIDDETTLGDWAEPDFVIALALPFETAALREQEFFELWGEGLAHQEAKRTFS
jgi:hypothetical protein